MKTVVGFVAAVMLLAGCLAVDPGQPTLYPGEDNLLQLEGIDLWGTPQPVPANESWSRFEVHASGGPGTWLFVHRALPKPTTDLHYQIIFEAEAKGSGNGPLALFTLPPTTVSNSGGNSSINFSDVHIAMDPEGLSAARKENRPQEEHRAENGDWGEIDGIVSAVGSTGSWTARIQVDIDGGNSTTGPSFVSESTGIHVAYPGEHLVDLPYDMVSSLYQETEVAEPGWAHIELQWTPLLKDTAQMGIKTCQIWFDDQNLRECRDVAVGVEAETGSFFEGKARAIWGQYPIGPSTVSVEVMYTQFVEKMDVVIVHLPIHAGTFPPGITSQGSYGLDKDLFTNKPYQNPVP